ncbi:unnamed protein product [Camellia sinensis]
MYSQRFSLLRRRFPSLLSVLRDSLSLSPPLFRLQLGPPSRPLDLVIFSKFSHKFTASTENHFEHFAVCELSDKFGDSVRVCEVMDNPITAKTSRSCGGGIEGVRPPVLAPPPSISLPSMDNSCSTWDILKSFAPDFNIDLSSAREYSSSDDDGEEIVSLNDRFSPTGDWVKGQLLGRGSFGSVYEGIAEGVHNTAETAKIASSRTAKPGGFFMMAVKEVSLLDQGDQGRQSISQLEQEIALLSHFEHENIVRYYGTDKWDIKCANILVHANGSVKLADFGLAKATELNDIKSCSPHCMAPEVIQALFQIGRGVPPPVPDSLSSDARDFILRCLQVNPNDRPTAADLLDHPYVRRPLPSSSGSSSPYNFG